MVVLDNASFHTSKVIRAARQGLADAGIYLYFLPPYSPELNRIEPVFRQVKHQEIPQRSHTTRAGLAGGRRDGLHQLRPEAPTEKSKRTTSSCLANARWPVAREIDGVAGRAGHL